MDWLDLLAVQGTLKSLLQQHSSKASILQPSAFFIVQLSHSYMTTRKTIALTRWTFVGKVMSLLFNTLSMLISSSLLYSKKKKKMSLAQWCISYKLKMGLRGVPRGTGVSQLSYTLLWQLSFGRPEWAGPRCTIWISGHTHLDFRSSLLLGLVDKPSLKYL